MRVRGTDENTVINEDSSSWYIHCHQCGHQCGFEVLMKILSSMRIRGVDLYTLSSMRVRGPDENTVINEDSSSWFIYCHQCGFEALMKILSSIRIRVLDLYIVINVINGFDLIYTLSSMWVRGTDENTVINEDSSSWFILDLYIVINASFWFEVRGTDENTVINEDSSSWFIHCHQCGFEVLMKILSSMRIRVLDLYIVINAGSRSWWKYCH